MSALEPVSPLLACVAVTTQTLSGGGRLGRDENPALCSIKFS